MAHGGAGYLQLSTLSTAAQGDAVAPRQSMADNTGEAAAAVPAALPAAPETAAETAPKLARGSSGLPKGVGFVKKSRNYQGRVYDSLETKKQRGIGTFATPELAAAAVEVAEAQLKQGISPWLAPTRVNKHKRGEAPEPVAKKRVPSVVVSERDNKPRETVPLPATVEEVHNACFAAFFAQRSGEDL